MDQSTEYQQHLQLQHHHQQHTVSDPYQLQIYDQSTQAYYTYDQYNPQQYTYYHQDYNSAYQQYLHQQQSQQEPTSIHPPGVPIPHQPTQMADPEQLLGNNSYYPKGVLDQHQLNSQQWQGNNGGFGQIRQSQYRGAGRRGGRPFRGGGRGHFARGRGRHFLSNSASMPAVDTATFVHGEASHIQGEPPQTLMAPPYASGPVQTPLNAPAQVRPTPIRQPPRMAWCELCRVDCNTYEILEQHKNGKRHKKNLKVYEELQNLQKILVGQNEQMPVSEVKPEVSVQPENVGGSGNKSQENLSSEAATENKVETDEQKVSGEQEPTEEPAGKQRTDRFEARRRGLKRKMRGGQGGKWMRTYEGSRRQVEPPPKPKEVIPLICELCNVKCESQVVFETHLAGKKHLSNFKRFQDEQAMLGQAALQALYPALQALYPALQALCTPNSNASTSFAPQFHQELVHGPQGFFPQPGPVMFPEGEAPGPGNTSASAPPPVLDIQDQQDSGSQVTSEAANGNAVTVEAKPQPESVTVNFEAEPASRKENKSEDGKSESEEINHPTDNSVVAVLGNKVAGSEQVSSGTATGEAGVLPTCRIVPSAQVAIP
ncbi:uncharacterized protein LOC132276494 isoform X2 [Cornus florida]|uniref:uncharacterized protein LOC132276494 isoform X2 n=1 Tax=Cornus florida TaxID=4283 RepID=UPI002899CC2A|nr:uncharacterized protein LOC132276494 isoform X2 [Cornus florida]